MSNSVKNELKLFLIVFFYYGKLEFFKKRIRGFQEKKLEEILSKIQFHQFMKKQAEAKMEGLAHDKTKAREEIKFNEKMINIWQKREENALRRQMSAMDD